MQAIARVVRGVSAINGLLGRIFSWFSLAIVLVCFTVVVLRYAFRIGSVPMQDLYVWLNGMMFMGIAGYALMKDAHVRVDIFYRGARTRTKALADMFGCLVFVAPFLWVLVRWSYPYVARSWGLGEGSPQCRRAAGPLRAQELRPGLRGGDRAAGDRHVPARRPGAGGTRGPAAAGLAVRGGLSGGRHPHWRGARRLMFFGDHRRADAGLPGRLHPGRDGADLRRSSATWLGVFDPSNLSAWRRATSAS